MASEAFAMDSGFRLFGPEMLADPYPVYHRLRSAHPVSWVAHLDSWVVTSYEAVCKGLRDPQLSSERFPRIKKRLAAKGLDQLLDERAVSMLHKDPPDHTRLRGLVNKAFTPRMVEAMENHIQTIVDGLLNAVQAQGHMDVIEDLAYPLPVTVIAEMLGVPTEDRERLKKWSDDISVVLGGDVASLPEPTFLRVLEARKELADYFRAVIAQRREIPGQDLLTALVQAEEDGGRLSEDELYSMVILILIAGNETTTNLIGNGLLALLRHPDQMRRVWEDAALVRPAVEEMLRYDGPVQLTSRLAKADLQIHGAPIQQGQGVYLLLAAANRDPAQFPDPDRFEAGRVENRHVAFGAGPHFCLGAPLARLEAQVVFQTLRRRFPSGMRLETERPEYRNNFNLRGLKTLPVAF